MKKALAVILSAVLFGAVAGGTILGITMLGKDRMHSQTEVVTEAETKAPEIAETQKAEKAAEAQETAAADGRLRLDVSDIVEEAMPQVVSITNTMVVKQQGYSSIFEYFYGGGMPREYEVPASGSGVILDKTDDELLIVTNNHVVEDSKELSVTFIDGESIDANVKGADPSIDLAVIAIPLSEIPDSTMEQIKIAQYHKNEDLKVGQGVIAIGNALGYGQTVTVGYISALEREITAEHTIYSNLIQTDAAINPGNSGGALLNMDGEVIGINVAKLSSTQVEGFGYSIPIYKAMDVIENLSTAKTKVAIDEDKRGRLGIYMNTISAENASALGIPAGVIIKGFSDELVEAYGAESVKESPARNAGILKNDIVTEFDGQRVATAEGLSELVSYYEEGSVVTIKVQRLENGSYEEHSFEVTLGSRSDATIEPISGEAAEKAENPSNGKEKLQKPSEKEKKSSFGLPKFSGKNTEADADENADTDNETEKEEAAEEDSDDMYKLFMEFLEQYQ